MLFERLPLVVTATPRDFADKGSGWSPTKAIFAVTMRCVGLLPDLWMTSYFPYFPCILAVCVCVGCVLVCCLYMA